MKQGLTKRRFVSPNQEAQNQPKILYDQTSKLYTITELQSPKVIQLIDSEKKHKEKMRLYEAGRMVLKTYELTSARNRSFRSNGSRYSSMPASPKRGVEDSRTETPIWARSGNFRRNMMNSPTKLRVNRFNTFRDNTAIAIL